MGIFMKNELFSTHEKKEIRIKVCLLVYSSIWDPRRTEKVKTGEVRSCKESTRPTELTCQSDTPKYLTFFSR